jgi:AcrR family transcriptional regulator
VTRIVEGALALLNRDGGSDVTTNHIAAHLRMSPGNLYYHFRNREEIVRAIFPHLVAHGLAATAPPANEVLTAQDFGERHLQGLQGLWRYRFFFRDLNQLLARDEGLAEDYRAYQRELAARYRILFDTLIAQGSMRVPEPAEDLGRLVTNSIVIWSSWIAHLTALLPRRDITRSDVAEGALHSFLVIAPYLSAPFATEARAVIEGHGRRERGARELDRGARTRRARESTRARTRRT